jgi:hypothetical protein
MRPCVEPSNGLAPLSPFPSWPDYIITTSGYDFRKGQVDGGWTAIDGAPTGLTKTHGDAQKQEREI